MTITEVKITPDEIGKFGDGEEIIKVKSHWNNDKAILVVDKKEYIVLADELKRAIDNATNH